MTITAPGTQPGTRPSLSLADRVYARTFAVTARGNPVCQADVAGAIEELLALAHGDAHVLGRVRDRFEVLRSERPLSEHVRQALQLVTETWMSAIQQA